MIEEKQLGIFKALKVTKLTRKSMKFTSGHPISVWRQKLYPSLASLKDIVKINKTDFRKKFCREKPVLLALGQN